MMDTIVQSYSNLPVHKVIGELIKKHSENKADIRLVAQKLIDWKAIRTILDCGCGYGWFEKALEGSFDSITGIDCLEENKAEFCEAARRIAKEVIFRNIFLPAPLDLPADHFDLIVSAYSLYFFPETLGEIKRMLRPEGTFLIITHSESMLKEGERYFNFTNLKKVIQGFSAENGEALLRQHFTRITSIDYDNAIVFNGDESADLALYIDFKKAFISRDAVPKLVMERMLDTLKTKGKLSFNKNDRIFVVQK
jgi:SAM-dependent methyltransferase